MIKRTLFAIKPSMALSAIRMFSTSNGLVVELAKSEDWESEVIAVIDKPVIVLVYESEDEKSANLSKFIEDEAIRQFAGTTAEMKLLKVNAKEHGELAAALGT